MNYLKMKKRHKERPPRKTNNTKVVLVNGGRICLDMATAPAEFARFGKELNKLAYPTEGEVDQAAVCAVTTKWLERIFGRGAVQKIFLTDKPNVFQLEEFVDKMADLFERWIKEDEHGA